MRKAHALDRVPRDEVAGAVRGATDADVRRAVDVHAGISRNSAKNWASPSPMGGVGSSADNALAESFNAALKREVLQDRSSWADATTCRREVFRWLARYNTKRRHSRCRHSSPAAYERTLTTATLPEAA